MNEDATAEHIFLEFFFLTAALQFKLYTNVTEQEITDNKRNMSLPTFTYSIEHTDIHCMDAGVDI